MGIDFTQRKLLESLETLGAIAVSDGSVRRDLLWTSAHPPDPRELVLGLRAIAWFFCSGAEAGFLGLTNDPDAQWQAHRGDWSQLAVLLEVDSAEQALWIERHLIQSVRQHEASRPPERRRFTQQGLGMGSALTGDGPWFVYACRR